MARPAPPSAPELAWTPPNDEVVAVAGPDGVELLGIASIRGITFVPDPPGLEGRVHRLRRLRLADPFVQFVMHLDDGRRIPVTRAESLAISPDGSAILFTGEDLV